MAAETLITAVLSTLNAADLSCLTHSISSVLHRHLFRLSSVLSSPILFCLALRHLHSLSLHKKSLLISSYLLSNLTLLTRTIIQEHTGKESQPLLHHSTRSGPMNLRELDAVLLLLLLCELQHHDRRSLDAPPMQWRAILCDFLSNTLLKLTRFGGWSGGEVLIQYIEDVGRCWNLVRVIGGKEGPETAASPSVLVSLPSMYVAGGRGLVVECVICKEEMMEGRQVCELPCGHWFHWICIITWLKKRSTCPCCRYRLPTEDVRREIERIMEEMAKIAHRSRQRD